MKRQKNILKKVISGFLALTLFIGAPCTEALASPKFTRHWMHGYENIQTSSLAHSTSSSVEAQINYSGSNVNYVHNVIRMGYYLDKSQSDNYAGVRLTAPEVGDFGYCAERLGFCYYNPTGRTMYVTVEGAVITQTIALQPCYNGEWKAIRLEGQRPEGNSMTHSNVRYIDLTLRGSSNGRLYKNLSGSIYFADFAFSNDPNYGPDK